MRRLEVIPDAGMVVLAREGTLLDAIERVGRANGADCYVLSDLVPPGQVFVIDVDAFYVDPPFNTQQGGQDEDEDDARRGAGRGSDDGDGAGRYPGDKPERRLGREQLDGDADA